MENQNQPTNITPDMQLLEQLRKWSNFVGIMTIISGAFTCLSAIFSFGLTLIPGIITIILGVKLINAKKSIELFIRGNSQEINGIFENLGSYFKIQGILIIVSFVFVVIGIIGSLALGFAFFNEMSTYY